MFSPLNESPSEKEGKSLQIYVHALRQPPSMKVPPKRKGNQKTGRDHIVQLVRPSMKVPPKRKGKLLNALKADRDAKTLNESPSEKEGKS